MNRLDINTLLSFLLSLKDGSFNNRVYLTVRIAPRTATKDFAILDEQSTLLGITNLLAVVNLRAALSVTSSILDEHVLDLTLLDDESSVERIRFLSSVTFTIPNLP